MTYYVFDKMFEELIGSEGGFQNDPKDRGNWTTGICGQGQCKGTKYGVSAMAYPNLDIENLSIEKAKEIFQKDYWDRCRCSNITDSIAILLSDFAYNSGVSRAVKCLQKVLGIKQDGIIGHQTVCAINMANQKKLIEEYCEERLIFLRGLKTFSIYGKGWTNRVNRIKKVSEEYL